MPNVDPFSVCFALPYGPGRPRGSRSGSSVQHLGGASVMERHGRDMRLGASSVDRQALRRDMCGARSVHWRLVLERLEGLQQ